VLVVVLVLLAALASVPIACESALVPPILHLPSFSPALPLRWAANILFRSHCVKKSSTIVKKQYFFSLYDLAFITIFNEKLQKK